MASPLQKCAQIVPPGWRTVAAAIVVGCAYYGGARFGLAVSFKPDYIGTLWPPNAVLAALLLSPPKKWWVFLAASVPAELLADLPQGIALWRALGFLAADWCEVLVAAFLIRRLIPEPLRFDTTRQLSLYFLCAAVAAPLISVIPGVTASTFGMAEVNIWTAARTWILSDSMSHFVLTPALVLWFATEPASETDRTAARRTEEGVILALIAGVSALVFGSGIFFLGHFHALLFTPLPLLLWSALRLGPRSTFTAALAITLISIWNASHGRGPFTEGPALGNVLDIQLFLFLALSPLLFLSCLIEERNATVEDLKNSQEELSIRNRITKVLLTVPDEDMYGEVLQILLEKTGSRHGLFGYLDEEGSLVCPSLSREIWEKCQMPDKKIIFPREAWGKSIWGRALREGKTLLSNGPLTVPAGHIPVARVINVPIVHAGRVIGIFILGNREQDYGEGDLRLLETLASNMAPVLLARLERDRREGERDRAGMALKEAYGELESQNEELRKLDRMKDSLIRDVTHELKTPVAKHAMQMEILSSLLEQKGLRETTAETLGVINHSIDRQKNVIQNILTFSRLETGKRVYRKDSVRLDALLREVLEDYRHTLQSHYFEVDTSLAPLVIPSDKDMLWHVFSNIFSNSIKYRRLEGKRTIDVRLQQIDGDAQITVTDNGVGLSVGEEERVFDRFYQARAAADGIGLGLTIAKMIAEGLGGRIWLKSEGKGQGVSATVAIPSTSQSPTTAPDSLEDTPS